MNFSLIIPTCSREKELGKCMNSILEQKIIPPEVILVDDDFLSLEFLKNYKNKFLNKGIKFFYFNKKRSGKAKGLSLSKNIGIKKSSNEIFFILDDDLILENDFFEKIMRVWEDNKDEKLIGVGGIIKNNRKKGRLEKIYNKIFGLTSNNKWDINDIGFQVWDEEIENKEKGYYAHGGVCSYKKSLVEKLGGFAIFSGGRTALEDIDFCLRAKNKGYYFIVESEAKVIHNHESPKAESQFLMGLKEGYNRKIIFKNNCKKSIKNYFWFFWANIGWILRQFLTGNFSKGLGMIKGFFKK